jgi:hypothetical protein
MHYDDMLREIILNHLKQRLSRDYKEIKVNPPGCPDLILSNHGLVLAKVQVETETSINEARADQWKELAGSGEKLILMVPKNAKVKAMELLWQKGIASKVGVGSYDITIAMP